VTGSQAISRSRRARRSWTVELPPFQRLLDDHRDAVYRYLLYAAGPNEADDCFQETWISALRAYPSLRGADNLRGWLLRIAHNKAIDASRSRGRRAVPVDELPEIPVAPSSDALDPALWSAVAALPTKQRGAVLLRFLADSSHAEIGVALDCSQDAARRNLHEGLNRLRRDWTP
jgi:RNA polymerase sigma factor (sigma-70 family)